MVSEGREDEDSGRDREHSESDRRKVPMNVKVLCWTQIVRWKALWAVLIMLLLLLAASGGHPSATCATC